MISSYFTEPKFNLDQIPPIINPEEFKNKTQDFWYLKNHDYQSFAFSDNVFCDNEFSIGYLEEMYKWSK